MPDAPDDMRELIDAVIASFRPGPFDRAAWSRSELALLTDLRERFIAAGAAHLEKVHNPTRSVEIGIRFRTRAQHRAFLRGTLRRLARTWIRRRDVTRFFFTNEPPGVRLRFSGRALETRLVPAIDELLDRERAARRIAGHESGVYDAESYQLGGDGGLDIAHDFFTYDSLAALDLLAVEPFANTADLMPLVSLMVMNHLIAQVCRDDLERWETWCNLRLAGRAPDLDDGSVARLDAELEQREDVLRATFEDPGALMSHLPPPIRRVVDRYVAESIRVGKRLARAAERGELLYGPRQILPFYVVSHWHRWLIGMDMQITLSHFMRRLLDPTRA